MASSLFYRNSANLAYSKLYQVEGTTRVNEKLQVFEVCGCPELSSLPTDINHLIALRELMIGLCPKLTERCKPEAGEDWPKIAHIPKIELDGEIIKSTENQGKLESNERICSFDFFNVLSRSIASCFLRTEGD